jgi:hypothetical protein
VLCPRYDTPLVADIHFQPAVAMMVAEAFEKVRGRGREQQLRGWGIFSCSGSRGSSNGGGSSSAGRKGSGGSSGKWWQQRKP